MTPFVLHMARRLALPEVPYEDRLTRAFAQADRVTDRLASL
jgi:hypothetical protein